MIHIHFGKNFLPSIVTVVAQHQFLITSTAQYFKNFHWTNIIFLDSSNERIYIGFHDGLGYRNEVKKPSRNDSKLTLIIELKSALAKKIRLRIWGYTNAEYLHMLVDGGLTLKYKIYTIRSQNYVLEECKELMLNAVFGT